MQTDLPLTRDLVLIGGGHAHALVMRRWGMNPLPGARLTVINPGPTAPYTGMLPGHVAGHYSRDDLDIDLVRLARFANARLIDGAVDHIDADARRISIAGWGALEYDVASIDVGITAEMPEIKGFTDHGTGAKPLGRFAARWRAFLAEVTAGTKPPQVAVIGGGVAGVELSLAMAHAMKSAGKVPQVTVIEAAEHLTGTGDKARRVLLAAMKGLGVSPCTGARVDRIAEDHVALDGGATIPAAFVTAAAGARPHGWIAGTGLPLEDGFICVGRTLAVEGRGDLFAAGDCAHLTHAPRPKAGVFAVRQAPILHDNLRAALSGGRMKSFVPQSTYLKLISMGGKSALAEKGGLTFSGSLLWRWKDHIDRTFMDKLKKLPVMSAPAVPNVRAMGGDAAKMLCAGCGSKIAGDALAQALTAVAPSVRADVLSRPGDDAAVLAHGDERQVITTDHLRAFTNDPALMTRIAAVHALGDVWSMGAKPQAALAQITLPRLSETLQARTLEEVLRAASDVFTAAGADLVGGHSTMGAEAVIGFTVTGLCDAPIGHDGAKPGDALLLTRPIGTGVVLAAEMAGAARGGDVLAMLERMAAPQGDAAAILSGAHAMTDVTGFGLAGHLMAICRASGVAAEVTLDAVPVYDGAVELSDAGHFSSLHAANVRGAPVTGGSGAKLALLHDPQTAGGMLAAVPADQAKALLARLRDAGHEAARIGTFTAGMPAIACV
ncbi:selenophosphate synthase [Jannaschia faecimaris]|uniref:Selenophosphate synthase n=1 Tax=Jannaschia faecimaris TaxID=1244108 RepID=A0A1H3THP5_9RHOB|nr:selenide, water dikinase SelD [Jannaschia faecimaris]SDZ49774.1 selenophosphate synthase [Jannaschia faecimaris]